jgi:hypothetical protein
VDALNMGDEETARGRQTFGCCILTEAALAAHDKEAEEAAQAACAATADPLPLAAGNWQGTSETTTAPTHFHATDRVDQVTRSLEAFGDLSGLLAQSAEASVQQEEPLPLVIVYVDREDQLAEVLSELSTHREIAFDAEGVNLGRKGELTIATFGGLDRAAPVYVVDVKVLGAAIAFSDGIFEQGPKYFRSLLEDPAITKVTFDCRGDSDALFHQFGVQLRSEFLLHKSPRSHCSKCRVAPLSGVLELQVLDQCSN